MLAEIATIGSALSGGGSFLSGLSGLFGRKKKKGPSMEEQLAAQSAASLDFQSKLPRVMKAAWKEAGIHPVYGMGGASSSFSPSFSVGGDSDGPSVGESVTQMGQGISRAAEALISTRERLQNRMIETQIEGQELENTKKAADLALVTGPMATPGIPDARYPGQDNMPIGYGDTGPLYRKAIDHNGRSIDVLNEDVVGDSEVLQALNAMVRTIPQWMANNVIMPMEDRRQDAYHRVSLQRQLDKGRFMAKRHKEKGWLRKYQNSFKKGGK